MKKLIPFLILITVISCIDNSPPSLNQIKPVSSEVQIFGDGFISTGMYERDLAISPDHKELMYTLSNYDQTHRSLIKLDYIDSIWTNKEMVHFSGRYNDIEPFYAPDGKSLFFASNRPIYGDTSRADYNIWVSYKHKGKWQEPEPLDSIINTNGNEFYPAVSGNGNLFFTGTKEIGIGLEDIYKSELIDGMYREPKVLDSVINTKSYEFNAYVSPNEDLLIFSSYGRKDGLGGGDLYYSKKNDQGKWLPSKSLGKLINTDKLDFCPFVDFKNEVFYFSSTRGNEFTEGYKTADEFIKASNNTMNGLGNIYHISLSALQLDK